ENRQSARALRGAAAMTWLGRERSGEGESLMPGLLNLGIFLLTALFLSFVLPSTFSEFLNPLVYMEGDVATSTVRAPRDFLIEDLRSSERRKSQAAAQVKHVFTIIEPSEEELGKQLRTLFNSARGIPAQVLGQPLSEETIKARKNLEQQFELDLRGN